MNLRSLKWLTIAIPIIFLAAFDYLRHRVFFTTLHTTPGFVLFLLVTFAGVFVFSHAVFGLIDRMEARMVRHNRELGAVAEVASALGQSLRLDEVMQIALDKSMAILDGDGGIICILDEEHKELVASAHRGISDELFAQLRRAKLSEDAVGAEVIKTGRPVMVDDAFADPATSEAAKREGFRTVMAIPLPAKGKAVGVLVLARRLERPFSSADAALLSAIAGQAGMAIQNAALHAQVEGLAVTEERGRIAREMHDGLAQVLGYINAQSLAVRKLVASGRVSEATAELARMDEAVQQVYAELREAILDLRTSPGSEVGFLSSLQGYLERYREMTGIQTVVEVRGPVDAVRLPPATEIQLMRIIQEALSNVRKHAKATAVTVSLNLDDEMLQVVVEDDGQGFDLERLPVRSRPRFGLQTMHERAQAIGGTFQITSHLAAGTSVIVRVHVGPITEEDKVAARVAGR